MRWRLLAILFVVLGVMVPTALANHDVWWGSWHGDKAGTPQRNNYVIHPPVDELPFVPGDNRKDGTRLSQIIHRPTGSAGTAAAYAPNQYFVSSTTPNVRFELRGGHWSEDNAGGQDRYDRDKANVNGIVDLAKKHGFASPIYYEVYQLQSGGPKDGTGGTAGGRFLGIINPRDRNVFPTTDNNPASNDECKFGNPNGDVSGPCWRTFSIGTGGGNITMDGGAQNSCAIRFGGSNPCFNTRRDNNKTHVHKADHVWVVRPNTSQDHGHASGDTPHSHHNIHSDTGDTSQLNRNDDAHDQFNTHPEFYRQEGNCFWEWQSENDLDGNDSGSQHSHRVFCGQFEDNVDVDYGDPHSHRNGSSIIAAKPNELFPGYYVLGVDKLEFYDRDPNNYRAGGNCFWGWEGHGDHHHTPNNPSTHTNFAHTHSAFCYDRTNSDGGAMSSANFNTVDPGTRFNSSVYPNLNGNYVFLIKAIVFEDRFNGYVTHFNNIKRTDTWENGCLTAAFDNTLRCPEIILRYAKSRNLSGPLIQNGHYIRGPKDWAGGKQFVASAPSSIAFDVNYGPVGGVENEPGEDHEYEEMAGQSYRGLRFHAGGAGCRNDDWSHRTPGGPTANAQFKVGNADWDAGTWNDEGDFAGYLPPFQGFEGPPPENDVGIAADVVRLGVMSENNVLDKSGYPQDERKVNYFSISGTWRTYPGWAIFLDEPNGSLNGYTEPWKSNEQLAGQFSIKHWNDGNNLYQGGAPFTWGYWPTCLRDGTGNPDFPDFTVTPHTPKSIFGGHKYNGRDNFTPTSNTGDAMVDFAFQYTLPETRGKVDYSVTVRRGGTTVAFVPRSDENVGPDTHQRRIPIQTNSFSANTTYTWQACVDPGPQPAPGTCTNPIAFQVNKGPTAQIVSGDPDYNTNTGSVNYNCSRLAVRLTDPENHDVRPYFAISWVQDGKTNVVTSFDRGATNSDSWGEWVNASGAPAPNDGYRPSGGTFTSDGVKPVRWTVNGSARSVPSKTLTEFLQQDVPEGVNVTWTASGEDRYGASDVGNSPTDLFYQTSNPLAVHDASSFGDFTKQVSMNYRRHGDFVKETFHKNTRPNLLPPGSTKKFYDLNGAVTEDVIDGQTVRVETKLKNTGETPTKRYEIYDYLGAVRDFDPPITTSADFPITVQYNDGTERAVEPLISTVIPNRRNGFLDRCVGGAGCQALTSNTARRASYKLDFGGNPDGGENISVTKHGKDYAGCVGDCRTDPSYPNSVYWLSGGADTEVPGNAISPPAPDEGGRAAVASARYRLDVNQAGTYDLTLQYFNGRTTDPSISGPGYPPPGYTYRIKVTYPTGFRTTATKTVRLPIESDERSRELHTFTVRDLDIGVANPTIRITWDNDYWQPGVYDANFGLNQLRLATAESDDTDSILRPGQLNPGETVTLRYYIRANRNRTAASLADQNQNFLRRLEVGSEAGPQRPRPDPKGGTVDIGDAHTFLPYSEDYCDRDNPLLNHTAEFKPGDVLAPWLRGQRGSIASNEGIFGFDPLTGEQNATFLVQANGVLSHFSGGFGERGDLGGYQAAPASCAPPGQVDWRKEMYRNVQRLLAEPYNNNPQAMLNGANVKRLDPGNQPNVWVADGDLTMGRDDRDTVFRGTGTIIVKGDLTIEGDMAYESTDRRIDSLGIIVLGNVEVEDSVQRLVGTYYVSDIRTDLSGTASGCPNTDPGSGRFTTGRSNVQLNVQGVLVARRFEFQRYFLDPSDTVADPAENVYYDGRVVANTPPGFGTFRNTASWYEIAP